MYIIVFWTTTAAVLIILDYNQANIHQSVLIIHMTICITCILNFGLLLLGAASRNDNLLRPWLCFSFIILLLIFCNAIFQLYEAEMKMFTLSFVELLVTGGVYSCVFCNFDELSNTVSDDEDEESEE